MVWFIIGLDVLKPETPHTRSFRLVLVVPTKDNLAPTMTKSDLFLDNRGNL